MKIRHAYFPFFCIEIICHAIIIIFNSNLFSVIFCTSAGTVILDDIFVLILCFMAYRLLFVERPFQELPQNVFVSRLVRY